MDNPNSHLNKRHEADKDASPKDIEVCGPLYRGGACNFSSCGHSSDHYHCPVCGHSTTEVSQALAHVSASPACRKDAVQGQYPSCSLAMSSDAATANSLYNAIYGGLSAQNAFPTSGYTGYGQMDSFQWHPSMSVEKVAICSTQLSPCCGSNGANRIPVDGQLCSPLGDLYSKVSAPVKELVSIPAKSGGTTMDSQAWFAAYNSQQIQKPVYKYPDQNSLPQLNFLLLDPAEQKHQDMNFLSAVDPNLNLSSSYSVKADYNKTDLNGRDLLKESYCTYASQSMSGMLAEDSIFSIQLSDDTLKQADLFHSHQQPFLPQINNNDLQTSAKKIAKVESTSNSTRHLNRFPQEHFGSCVSSCSVYSSAVMPVKLSDQNDENSNQTSSSASDSDESDIIVEDTGDELGNEITESEISIEDIKCSLLQGVVSEQENIHNISKSSYRGKSRRDSEKLRKEQDNLCDLTKESEPQHEPCQATCSTEVRCAACSRSVSEETPGSLFIQMSNVLPVTSSSNTPILSKLSQIISTNVVELLNEYGHFICQRCFNLVDAVDALELKLESAKQNLTSLFKACSKSSMSNTEQCTKLVVDLMEENQQSMIEIPLADIPKVKSPVSVCEVSLQNVEPLLSNNMETNLNDHRSRETQKSCRETRDGDLHTVVPKESFLIISSGVVAGVVEQIEIGSSPHDTCQNESCADRNNSSQNDSTERETHLDTSTDVLPPITHLAAPENQPPVLHLSSDQQSLSDLKDHFFVQEKQTETPPIVSCQTEEVQNKLENNQVRENLKCKFSCKNCNELFQTCKDLKAHESIHHNSESSLLCETCGKRFQLRKQLDDHKARHKKILNAHCEYCGKSFASTSLLVVHIRSHTGEKPFACSTCKRSFAHRSNLTAHQNICSGCSPFRCEKCGLSFPLPSVLEKHNKINHDLMSECLKCSECHRSFSKPSDLQAHQRVHSSERSFACEVCGRRYKSLGNLNHHIKSHLSKRPFTCDVCNLGFLRKDSLEAHIYSHKGEKSYSCGKCPKSFWSMKNLKSHLKWHDGAVKRNTCPVCDKTFTQKLRIHMRTHTGEKPFCCQFCSQRFSTKHSLNKHCQSKHSLPPAPSTCSSNSEISSC